MSAETRMVSWHRYVGPLLTLLAILVAEVGRDTGVPAPAPVVILILALGPVAYSGLAGGYLQAAVSAAVLGAYTLHFLSVASLFDVTPADYQGGFIMLGVGLAMGLPMAGVKQREDRLRAEIVGRATQLERRNRELTDANGALEAFGYVVSHDLKEPVRAIRAYLESARESEGPQARADLERAFEANERLSRLLEGLLAYSRASSIATTTRELDIKSVLESDSCRSQYERLLSEKHATLQIATELPRVLGDEVILAQLFGNIILNALKHGNEKPVVQVRGGSAASPGRAHVIIEDDGPGFPPEVIQRFRALRARPATVRSGFGLVITHRAAQRLDGRVWLENRTEGGARVHVDLPGAP